MFVFGRPIGLTFKTLPFKERPKGYVKPETDNQFIAKSSLLGPPAGGTNVQTNRRSIVSSYKPSNAGEGFPQLNL